MAEQPSLFQQARSQQRRQRRQVQRCPHCGAKMVRYRHSLNQALAVGLRRLAENGGEGNLKELGLTRNQWDNFQKLRYWGLVEQTGQRGVWRVTARGRRFLSGTAEPRTAITYRGETQHLEGPLITIDEVDPGYAKLRDYAASAEPVDD